jgi:membrane protein DedA with SNARE-associated domain
MIAGTFSDFITDLTDWLDQISSHWWFLLVIFAIAYLDSVIPIVPSETCVIIGGVAASQGTQNIFLVIAFAAVGAFLGDNTPTSSVGASGWFHRR